MDGCGWIVTDQRRPRVPPCGMVGADIALRVFVALLSRVRRSLRGRNLAIGSLAVVVSPRVRAIGQLCLGIAFWNVFAILCISRGATRIYFSCYKGKRKFVSVGSWLAASRSFFRQPAFSQFLLPSSKPASFEAARVS